MKLAYSLLFALSACVVASPDDVEDEGQVDQALSCPAWGCGTNSPIVGDGLMFDELDSSGVTANRGGLKIVGAKLYDGTPVKVKAERQSLVAYSVFTGRRYVDSQLTGMIITLRHPTNGDYEILIEKFYAQNLWFWSGIAETVPAYEMKTRKVGTTYFKESVCKGDALTTDPHWTGIEHAAIVFQGDRYDPVAKKVWETSSTDPWFNIACAGTTPAKLHLMRHTRAGSYRADGTVAYDTTVAERQAMLKMFVADYCGNGTSFTVDGQPLAYNDSNGWYREYTGYAAQEALWSDSGAICLDWVRRETEYTLYDVYAKCGRTLPSCGSFSWPPWQWRAHVMSGKRP